MPSKFRRCPIDFRSQSSLLDLLIVLLVMLVTILSFCDGLVRILVEGGRRGGEEGTWRVGRRSITSEF